MEEQEQKDVKQKGLATLKGVFDNKAKVTAENIARLLEDGEANPIYVAVVLKKFAKIQELINENKVIKELILEEVRKNLEGNKKTTKLFGASITIASGSYWDYSTTSDPYLDEMQKIVDELTELIKNRKKEIELKATIFHNRKPHEIIGSGLGSFNLQYDRLPVLTWEEGIEVVSTQPPIQKGSETLRFTV